MTLSACRRFRALVASLALAHCGRRDGDPGADQPVRCRNRASGDWVPMRTKAPKTVHPAGFWTGSEVIIWGGDLEKTDPLSDPPLTAAPHGWRYSPVEDSWRPMAPNWPPEPPSSHGVWTGSELLDFLGLRRYGVSNDEWTDIPTPAWINRDCWGCVGYPIWTGSIALLYYGPNDGPIHPLLAFDPSRNEWSDLSGTGIHPEPFWSALWIGDSLFVFTTNADGDSSASRFYPDTETWTPASTVGMPEDGCWHVGTGDRLLGWCTDPPRGAAYDPGRDEWQAIAADGAAKGAAGDAVWTGSEVVLWGNRQVGDRRFREFGAAYDPKTGTWRALTADGVPRSGHAMVWTGCEIVVWGGYDLSRERYRGGEGYLDTGFVLRP